MDIMQIKFNRLDRLYEEHKTDIISIADKVYSSGQVLQDKSIHQLEEKIAAMCQRKYAIAVGSCTDAITMTLRMIRMSDSYPLVGVTKFTFPGSYTGIESLGLTAAFFDYNKETFQPIYPDSLFNCNTIIAVNLFGQMMDMNHLQQLCGETTSLIEDAAQSFTSNYNGKPAGSFGWVSCLSFDPTKICPAFSTGGMCLTNQSNIYKDLKYRHYKYNGQNSQMDTFTANLLLYWLPKLPEWEEKRREIAAAYNTGLSIPQIKLPVLIEKSKHIWHKFVIRCERRDELKKYLAIKGIETKIHYDIDKEVLSLPIYPQLLKEEIDYIIQCTRRFYL